MTTAVSHNPIQYVLPLPLLQERDAAWFSVGFVSAVDHANLFSRMKCFEWSGFYLVT